MKRAKPTKAPFRIDMMMYPANISILTFQDECEIRTVCTIAIHEQKHDTVTNKKLYHMDEAPRQLLKHDHERFMLWLVSSTINLICNKKATTYLYTWSALDLSEC